MAGITTSGRPGLSVGDWYSPQGALAKIRGRRQPAITLTEDDHRREIMKTLLSNPSVDLSNPAALEGIKRVADEYSRTGRKADAGTTDEAIRGAVAAQGAARLSPNLQAAEALSSVQAARHTRWLEANKILRQRQAEQQLPAMQQQERDRASRAAAAGPTVPSPAPVGVPAPAPVAAPRATPPTAITPATPAQTAAIGQTGTVPRIQGPAGATPTETVPVEATLPSILTPEQRRAQMATRQVAPGVVVPSRIETDLSTGGVVPWPAAQVTAHLQQRIDSLDADIAKTAQDLKAETARRIQTGGGGGGGAFGGGLPNIYPTLAEKALQAKLEGQKRDRASLESGRTGRIAAGLKPWTGVPGTEGGLPAWMRPTGPVTMPPEVTALQGVVAPSQPAGAVPTVQGGVVPSQPVSAIVRPGEPAPAPTPAPQPSAGGVSGIIRDPRTGIVMLEKDFEADQQTPTRQAFDYTNQTLPLLRAKELLDRRANAVANAMWKESDPTAKATLNRYWRELDAQRTTLDQKLQTAPQAPEARALGADQAEVQRRAVLQAEINKRIGAGSMAQAAQERIARLTKEATPPAEPGWAGIPTKAPTGVAAGTLAQKIRMDDFTMRQAISEMPKAEQILLAQDAKALSKEVVPDKDPATGAPTILLGPQQIHQSKYDEALNRVKASVAKYSRGEQASSPAPVPAGGAQPAGAQPAAPTESTDLSAIEEDAIVETDEDYDALPSGAIYVDPQGQRRRKS